MEQNSPNTDESLWRVFALLVDKQWLRNILAITWQFAPRCILPAALCTFASIVAIAANILSAAPFHASKLELTSFISAFLISLLGLIVCLVALPWALAMWIMRLTGYARAISSLPSTALAAPLTQDNIQIALTQATDAVAQRKKYLTKFFMFVTLNMALPAIIFLVAATLVIMSTPMLMPNMATILPQWLGLVALCVATIIGFFLVGYSFIAVAVAGISDSKPHEHAWRSLVLTIKGILPISLIVLLVTAIDTFISSPQTFFRPMIVGPFAHQLGDLAGLSLEQIWSGIVSVVLLPLCIAPFCELIRGRIDK